MSLASSNTRRILITGVGIVSPLGVGRQSFLQNLREGQSGIGPVEAYPATILPGAVAGECREFTEETARRDYLQNQRKSLKVMCREILMAHAAANLAMDDSRIDLNAIDHDRIGVDFGSSSMYFWPDAVSDACRTCMNEKREFIYDRWGGPGLVKMDPLWMLKHLPNMPSCHIAIAFDARGPSNSITMEDISAGAALNEAFQIIQRGWADIMITGSTGTRLHPTQAIHARMWDNLAYDPEQPSASCKPFDVRRTGQVVGEGAGCFIFEEESHAKARGATVYGRFLGGHSSCVADKSGKPNKAQAVANAINGALEQAGLSPSDIGHINAHGIGDIHDDVAEAEGLRETFGTGLDQIPVIALKGYFGNSGSGVGMLEITASLLAAREGWIPHSINTTRLDPACRISLVMGKPREIKNRIFVNVNYTRMGQASAVIIEAM